MGRFIAMLCLIALVAGACGGDDAGSDPSAGNGTSQNGDLDFDLLGFDTSFETGDLPDDFPAEYAPSDIVAGQVAELGGHTTVSFYSNMSFDEALSFYEPLLGAPILVGDRGQRRSIRGGPPPHRLHPSRRIAERLPAPLLASPLAGVREGGARSRAQERAFTPLLASPTRCARGGGNPDA